MSIDDLVEIYETRARHAYGLAGVSQLEHALQAAANAQRAGAANTLIVATLLHDIGHLVHDLGETPAEVGIDDQHERLGSVHLSQLFPVEVSEPVRLHVAAKRYLVAAEGDYADRLSAESIRSLNLQGGPMSAAEQADFRRQAWWRDAVTLRRCDEDAKVPGAATPSFRDFLPIVEACLLAR